MRGGPDPSLSTGLRCELNYLRMVLEFTCRFPVRFAGEFVVFLRFFRLRLAKCNATEALDKWAGGGCPARASSPPHRPRSQPRLRYKHGLELDVGICTLFRQRSPGE